MVSSAPIPDLPLVRPGSLVIEANPLKYSVMAARSLALGLLLLLCVTPVGWAAEPAGATVVLQLPASMSPDRDARPVRNHGFQIAARRDGWRAGRELRRRPKSRGPRTSSACWMGFFGNCDNRKLHRLKRECLHDSGGPPWAAILTEQRSPVAAKVVSVTVTVA
jgi:hypothetical protein